MSHSSGMSNTGKHVLNAPKQTAKLAHPHILLWDVITGLNQMRQSVIQVTNEAFSTQLSKTIIRRPK